MTQGIQIKNQVQVKGKDITRSGSSDVGRFLETVKRVPARKTGTEPGRLIFAMDATLSRAATWDMATHIQNEMFDSTANLGGLAIQLCHFKGFREFSSSDWCTDGDALRDQMSRVRCSGGQTQIHRVLSHCLNENRRQKIQALVFVGDAMEENADSLCELAGQMGISKIPAFVFQEGVDQTTRQTFQEIARLSGGAYAPFNLTSADELKSLLSAVAVYAAGGSKALLNIKNNKAVGLLTRQLKE
ncbi:MAG: hypothetical protein ACI9HA_002351 [Dinoroseobacter sp.]